MFYALNMVACLAAVVTPQSFDIEVPKVAPIVQGQAMEVEVLLTYRDKRSIRVEWCRYKDPLGYILPQAWKPTPKLFSGKLLGPDETIMHSGEKIRHTIDLRLKQELSETPGKYEVEIQCYMPGSYVADGPKLLHVSK
jgi:hypothetical protein